MRPADIKVFRRAAVNFQVYIIVRHTNPESLKYIGMPLYIPKHIDCKAKTADRDFFSHRLQHQLRVGGLVVRPDLPEFDRAFNTAEKFRKAIEIWAKFSRDHVAPTFGTDPRKSQMEGKFYVVQTAKTSQHYGCVMFARGGVPEAACYIHGDYDLYAIFPRTDKLRMDFIEKGQTYMPLDRVDGTLLGQPHYTGRWFPEVQRYLNSNLSVPMVLHGAQEHVGHLPDNLDIFCPDGTVKLMLGPNLIDLIRNPLAPAV